jgi:hypothetical protein
MIKNLSVKIICSLILLVSTNSMAADEPLVMKYLEKTHFRANLESRVRNTQMGLSKDMHDKVVANVNFDAIETAYRKVLAAEMTNDEINALLEAYDIPGYSKALEKQSNASTKVLSIAVKEMQKAVKSYNSKSKPPNSL